MPPGARSRRRSRSVPLKLVARALGNLRDNLLLERQQPLRPPVEAHSGLGGRHAAARAVEELGSETLFERPDLQTHRGLSHTEPLGRLREAPPLDNRAEGRKLPRVHPLRPRREKR